MATVPPKPSGKGAPPVLAQTVGNLDKPEPEGYATLNFKPTKAFKREFKTFAAEHDMDMQELLVRSFKTYKERYGR